MAAAGHVSHTSSRVIIVKDCQVRNCHHTESTLAVSASNLGQIPHVEDLPNLDVDFRAELGGTKARAGVNNVRKHRFASNPAGPFPIF